MFDNFYASYGKRAFDLLLTIPSLIVLTPFLAVLAISVRLSFCAPLLFRQERAGMGGKPFTIVKFVTMTNARDGDGKLLPDAQRLTSFGSFLRGSSLDELPELYNVVRGEMSLVGPRPLHTRYLSRYTPEQLRRHEVHPGITGWAQVNGRNGLRWEEKFAFDVWYVDNQNFWLDLKILFMTFWNLVQREGINQGGEATMEEFLGTDNRKFSSPSRTAMTTGCPKTETEAS